MGTLGIGQAIIFSMGIFWLGFGLIMVVVCKKLDKIITLLEAIK